MLARLLPSTMFHRRLLLLWALTMLGMVAPTLQLARWTLLNGDQKRTDAEQHLIAWYWLPTTRGRILDRYGKVLAQDRPSFDIAVNYRVITGEWAYDQAFKRAHRTYRDVWSSRGNAQKRDLAEEFEPEYGAMLDSMWDRFAAMGGVGRAELEARKDAVLTRVQRMVAQSRARALEKREDEAADTGHQPSGKPKEIKLAEQEQAHVLLTSVDDRTAFEFLRLAQEPDAEAGGVEGAMPGLTVIDTRTRDYPFETMDVDVDRTSFPSPIKRDAPVHVRVDGVATHTVGWMRTRVFAEDNSAKQEVHDDGARDRSFYLQGDSVGNAGFERAAEDDLRGLRGLQTRHLDSGLLEATPPAPGKDIPLTIDISLQARIQALLSPEVGLTVVQPWHTAKHLDEGEPPQGVPTLGEALAGSAVVIEVDTGDILALVTSPTFSRKAIQEQPESVFGDKVFMPALNRAISQPYQPGSIVKPIVLCGATTSGLYRPDELIACTGHFLPNSVDKMRCWIYKMTNNTMTHSAKFGHDLNGSDALMASCNIFFFEMGKRLGVRGIDDWFTRFGLGPDAVRWNLAGVPEKYDTDLTSQGDPRPRSNPFQEFPGFLPREKGTTTTDASLMGIGQGRIAWTPLHAADAYATVARGGLRIIPRLGKDSPARSIDLHIDPRAIEQALDGLRRSVQEHDGTTNHLSVDGPLGTKREEPVFNSASLPGIAIWAKSGTADAHALTEVTTDADEHKTIKIIRDGDHAWCLCLVGDGATPLPNDPYAGARPRYAVAVVIDYGGSGGRVAGPIANQIVRALIAEGYLHAGKEPGRAATPADPPH